ncbi:MAG: ComEC family competence protein [Xanthobacteraceae bacterium]|nr:ComEC family competence protein [Xanthobacteraceae bacterium]
MTDWGGDSRVGSRGRAETWDGEARRRRAFATVGGSSTFGAALTRRLRAWVIVDTGPGRLLPWLPVAFGLGIAIYFAAEREPAWWAAVGLTLVCSSVAILARRRPIAFPLALAAAAVAAGFAVATLNTVRVAHPVLVRTAANVTIAGFVEVREERERTDRIVVRALSFEGARPEQKIERVRVSVRKGTAPPVGSYVSFRARLNPPLEPLRPGGYDFARDLYFHGIGATGFALGAIQIARPPAEPSLWLRYAATVQGIRDAIDARIRAALPGDKGAIASALVTGKRDAITAAVNDAMYVSSLAHVLSISGYHMAVVAGVVFFVLRALLALSPALASGRPIKKWSAAGALVAAAAYLILSGAEVATQRAFIMTAIVLIGVMADRAALTLRTLAIAALAVMLFAPQSVVHPSFQMSFAATLALIAAYERGLPWMAKADTSWSARAALWGGREIFALVLVSLVAGLATTPYAAYHFHRLAPYGVIANLFAMPIVSAWIMPAGLLALVAMPFGLDGLLWWLMGEGIGWMIIIAQFVAGLPGAVGRMAAFGVGPLLLGTGGLVLLGLLKTPLRWTGALVVIAAGIWAIRAPLPDVLISSDAQAVAVRGADGRLSVSRSGRDGFAVREWLAADGDERKPDDATLARGFRCDASGCIAKLPDGRLVAQVLAADAFVEDCRKAAVVVTAREAPPKCEALIVDRNVSRAQGAIALRRNGDQWDWTAARPKGHDRPWARTLAAPVETPAPSAARPQPRDATPRTEDMEPGD